jgi:hypothetical protein
MALLVCDLWIQVHIALPERATKTLNYFSSPSSVARIRIRIRQRISISTRVGHATPRGSEAYGVDVTFATSQQSAG